VGFFNWSNIILKFETKLPTYIISSPKRANDLNFVGGGAIFIFKPLPLQAHAWLRPWLTERLTERQEIICKQRPEYVIEYGIRQAIVSRACNVDVKLT